MKTVLTVLATLILTGSVQAQDSDPFVTFKVLKPELAVAAAVGAMDYCRDQGYQVGVSVVDRTGGQQAFVRDRFAGPHVNETAFRKAWTAVSFRSDTLALGELTAPGTISSGIRDLSMPLALGGGVPIEHAGSIIGGIGVSGAPGPDIDDECARAGIEAIEDEMGF